MIDAAPLDPELALSLAYVPAKQRDAVRLLWLLDERLGAITEQANPAIAAIKLAWWREALERLDTAPPPAEPLLRDVADRLISAGVTGAELAAVAGGWDALLDSDGQEDEEAKRAMLLRHARERGAGMFALVARLLGGAAGVDVAPAGELWALASLKDPWSGPAVTIARDRVSPVSRWPRGLRALGMIALLARDRVRHGQEAGRSLGRVGRLMWHALSGY